MSTGNQNNEPQFVMSMYANKEDLYKSKADYYERQLRLAESVIEKPKPYSVNERQMVNSYYRYK